MDSKARLSFYFHICPPQTRANLHAMLVTYYDSHNYHEESLDTRQWVPRYTKEGIKLDRVPAHAWRLIKEWHNRTVEGNLWERGEGGRKGRVGGRSGTTNKI